MTVNKKSRGTVYWDNSLKETRHGRAIYHRCYRAEIQIGTGDNVQRVRKRFQSVESARDWLAAMQRAHFGN